MILESEIDARVIESNSQRMRTAIFRQTLRILKQCNEQSV